MPLTEKGKKIKKAMEKQYGKKKAEKIFYASKNAGKITGVEKKMKVKKASLGLAVGFGADKLLKKSEGARKFANLFGLTGMAASKYYSDKAKKAGQPEEQETEKASKGKMMKLKGGGAAIRGTKFKGVF